MLKKFCIPLIALAVATGSAGASDWAVDYDASTVGFTAGQQGKMFEGHFDVFEATISLDPATPEAGSITAMIDMASADAGAKDRNDALPTGDWFAVKKHPKATFTSEEIVSTGQGTYEARGTLTMKGVSREIVLPFTLAIDGDTANAAGSLDLTRTDYDVGTGPYAKGNWVDLTVTVNIEITATRAD